MDALDPYTEQVIQKLAVKLVSQVQTRSNLPVSGMCEELIMMTQLIAPIGFRMMGAHQLQFDNEQYKLQWKMGVGALMDTVEFSYDYGKDLYNLRFRRYADASIIDKETEFFGVYNDGVIALIEEQTGFYLRL